jgi:hypothetical protein
LREFAAGLSKTTISGRVVQWLTEIGWPRPGEDAPVPDAIVSLQDGKNQTQRKSDAHGAFLFEVKGTGPFILTADAPGFEAALPTEPFVVQPGSCIESFPLLKPRTVLSGIASLPNGDPAPKLRVEVVRRNEDRKWYSTYQFWTTTDKNGHFEFKDLPAGDYLVGYEIWSDRPSQYSGYSTKYYPNAANRLKASTITLFPGQAVRNLAFQLDPPHHERIIRVQDRWPNGTAPTENLVQLFDGDSLLQNIGLSIRGNVSHHQGLFEVEGYEERKYQLHVRYWIDDLGGLVPHDLQRIAKSKVVEVAPGKGPLTVTLVLDRQRLADEER